MQCLEYINYSNPDAIQKATWKRRACILFFPGVYSDAAPLLRNGPPKSSGKLMATKSVNLLGPIQLSLVPYVAIYRSAGRGSESGGALRRLTLQEVSEQTSKDHSGHR